MVALKLLDNPQDQHLAVFAKSIASKILPETQVPFSLSLSYPSTVFAILSVHHALPA